MVTNSHIRIATQIAKYSDVIKAKMSAIAILKNGTIIASANNRKLTGDYIRWSCHAEEGLIRKLLKLKAFDRFSDITVFVFRISSQGIQMARPCARCQKLLNKYPVKVLYTDEKGTIKEL